MEVMIEKRANNLINKNYYIQEENNWLDDEVKVSADKQD
jgi:hypothetical protein